MQRDELHVVSMSVFTCFCIFIVSYNLSGSIVWNLILPVSINVCYIIENVSLYQQNKCYKSEIKDYAITVNELKENCRQLIIQNTHLEIAKRKCAMKDLTRSNSAKF